jgi:small subunit ribosomal protein S20
VATHKSAAKRARQDKRRNAINRQTRSKVRTIEIKVRQLIAKKDKKSAEELMSTLMSTIGKAAKKGSIHARNAARRISRVSAQVAHLK